MKKNYTLLSIFLLLLSTQFRSQVQCTLAVSANPTAMCYGLSSTLTALGSAGTQYTWSTGSNSSAIVVTPSVTSTYTVIGKKGNCINTRTVSVIVNQLPVISVNSGAICMGQSFTMVPSGAATYTFSNGSAVVSPTVTSSYSVAGTSSAGCLSASPAVANVTVNPLPVFSVNSGTICSGQSFTIVPSGASTYSYSYSGGSNVVSPGSTTSYSVYATDLLTGCVGGPQISTVFVNPTPTISANSGAICAGDSFTIIPSGAVTYTISGGSAVVSPSSSTSYSVWGTSAQGCIGGPAISNVTVNPLPVISVNSGAICTGDSFTMTPSGAATYTFSGGSAIVSPTANSTYSVWGTSAEGCVGGPAISNVTVNPLPVISVNSGAICNGDSFTMTPSGAATYTFSGGSAIVSPTANTTYSVWGTSAEGCVGGPAISNVTVNPLPVISVNSGAICNGDSFTMTPSGAATYTFSGGSAIVSPTANTTYSVWGTSAEGCVGGPAISNVTVNPLPVISVNSGAICNGDSFTMTPSGAATYTFSGGSAIVSPTTNTSYSVWGTSAEGCVSAAPAIANVTVNALPLADAGPDQTIYIGYGPNQCASLNGTATGAPGPYQYAWSQGGLTQSIVVCPTVTTVYQLTVTANGCSGTDQVTVHVLDVSCSGNKVLICHNGHTICVAQAAVPAHLAHGDNLGPCINNNQRSIGKGSGEEKLIMDDEWLRIYPNPNDGNFLLEMNFAEEIGWLDIEVRNIEGQLIHFDSYTINSKNHQMVALDKNIPAGIYFVRVSDGKQSYTTKMLLQR